MRYCSFITLLQSDCPIGEDVHNVIGAGHSVSNAFRREVDNSAKEQGVGCGDEGTWPIFVLEENFSWFILLGR